MSLYFQKGKNKRTDNPPGKHTLGLFGLSMINIVAIASLRDLPQMAKYGWGSVFFYVLAALVFFFRFLWWRRNSSLPGRCEVGSTLG